MRQQQNQHQHNCAEDSFSVERNSGKIHLKEDLAREAPVKKKAKSETTGQRVVEHSQYLGLYAHLEDPVLVLAESRGVAKDSEEESNSRESQNSVFQER